MKKSHLAAYLVIGIPLLAIAFSAVYILVPHQSKKLTPLEIEQIFLTAATGRFLSSGFDKVPEEVQIKKADEYWKKEVEPMIHYTPKEEVRLQKEVLLSIIHAKNLPGANNTDSDERDHPSE